MHVTLHLQVILALATVVASLEAVGNAYSALANVATALTTMPRRPSRR